MSESVTGQSLHQWRAWAIQLAKANNIDPYEVDWLLQGLSPLTSTTLKLESYQTQTAIPLKAPLEEFTAKWNQRISDRTPIQYLVGETPWRNFTLSVTPDVLIPRPETELIIDIAKSLVKESPTKEELLHGHWADLGTGSGAIALGLAHTFPNATVHAIDLSPKSLAIAKYNAVQCHFDHRITFYQGSWLSPLSSLKGKLAAIVSNPPYIPTDTIPTLQPEVAQHEPRQALDGGNDGLDCIKSLIQAGANYLQPGGLWLVEHMATQSTAIEHLLQQQDSYNHIKTHLDLSGVDRFVSACKAV